MLLNVKGNVKGPQSGCTPATEPKDRRAGPRNAHRRKHEKEWEDWEPSRSHHTAPLYKWRRTLFYGTRFWGVTPEFRTTQKSQKDPQNSFIPCAPQAREETLGAGHPLRTPTSPGTDETCFVRHLLGLSENAQRGSFRTSTTDDLLPTTGRRAHAPRSLWS